MMGDTSKGVKLDAVAEAMYAQTMIADCDLADSSLAQTCKTATVPLKRGLELTLCHHGVGGYSLLMRRVGARPSDLEVRICNEAFFRGDAAEVPVASWPVVTECVTGPFNHTRRLDWLTGAQYEQATEPVDMEDFSCRMCRSNDHVGTTHGCDHSR